VHRCLRSPEERRNTLNTQASAAGDDSLFKHGGAYG
jgi:hypothetical protein